MSEALRDAKRGLFLIGLALAVSVTLGQGIGWAQGDLIRGRTMYLRNCANCHGEFGKGDGPGAASLQPKPTNLADPVVMENITPEKFERAVVVGPPNVKDHTFGHLLTPEEVRDITKYVRSLIR